MTPHILLIDPSHRDRDHYTQRLQTSSVQLVVFHAITGQAGLDLCSRQRVNCIVLELDLPDMSGFEVLLRLVPHPQHPAIPVIILTRIANQYLLDAAINNGAQAAFHKSISSEEVLLNVILKSITTIEKDLKGGRCLASAGLIPGSGLTYGSQGRA